MTFSSAVPRHVAVVMDGNGRWAKKRFLPRLAGHKQGLESLRRCVRHCIERGVRVLTVFAFSSENWNRPAEEVSGLMNLLAGALAREVPSLHQEGVQLHFVGERSSLSDKVVAGFLQAEALTASNDRLVLNVCFNYGGRWDIAQAAAGLAAQGIAITGKQPGCRPGHGPCARPGLADPHRGRIPHQQFPAVAGRILGAVFQPRPVARF